MDHKESLDSGSSPTQHDEQELNKAQCSSQEVNAKEQQQQQQQQQEEDCQVRPFLRGFKSWPEFESRKVGVLVASATFNSAVPMENSPASQHSPKETTGGDGAQQLQQQQQQQQQGSETSDAMVNAMPSSTSEAKILNHSVTIDSQGNHSFASANSNCQRTSRHQTNELIDKVRTILCRGSSGVESEWDSRVILGRCNLFTQIDILCHSQSGSSGWKQMARYLKYEEKVEIGGRWSKPHVNTASLHALLQIRRSISDRSCVVDLDASPRSSSLTAMSEAITEAIAKRKKLDGFVLANLSRILCRPHKHKNRQGKKKKTNNKKQQQQQQQNPANDFSDGSSSFRPRGASNPSMQRRKSLVRRDGKDYWAIYTTYHQGIDPDHLWPYAPNKKLTRKIPTGAEAAMVMVGQVDFLDDSLVVFCRLRRAQVVEELLEVAIPTRFIVLVFGPTKGTSISEYFDIGRAFASILGDKVFCEVAYKAVSAQDLLDGLDEFMDDLTVLPPSIWDPTTSLEPPKSTRPADRIWKRLNEATRYINSAPETSAVHDETNDESLRRTGRIFGGLVADIRNRYRFFVSDFTDGLHPQCFASVVFLYFACITPIVTFGGLMGQETDNYMGTMETLMSGAICGVVYALFSGQPLTIIGSTGPLLVFESILYHLCKEREIEFLPFRFWIGIWVFVYLLLIVAFDLSAFVRYITRFTEESFAVLISVIFIYEACSKILDIWTTHPVMRNQAERQSRNSGCYCASPPHHHQHQHQHQDTTVNSTSVKTTTLPAPALVVVDGVDSLDQRGPPPDIPWDGNSSFADIGDWSRVLSEDCLTFRQRVVVGYGCVSAADCADRGWVLTAPESSSSGCAEASVQSVPDVFLLSCILFFGTFSAAMFFRTLRNSPYFPTQVRTLVSDFAVFLAVITWSAVDYYFSLDTPKLVVPNQIKPTLPNRGWFVNPLRMSSAWLIAAGALPGALATILVFLDQQITAVIVNRKEHKLKKGHGYHLDLLVLSFLIAVCSALGLPWFVAATVRAITHVRSLIRESEVKAPGERPQMLGVREQRLTGVCIHLLIGLSSLLTSVLKHLPMPVLYGVFLYMGVTSLAGVQFIERILIMFMPVKYQPDYIYLRHVQTSRVHYFTVIQVACSALMWVIKSVKVTSIAFPLMLIGLVTTRKAMDFVFTQRDLFWLDNLLPDDKRRRFEDFNRKFAAASTSPGATTPPLGNERLTPTQTTDANMIKQ